MSSDEGLIIKQNPLDSQWYFENDTFWKYVSIHEILFTLCRMILEA